MLLRIVRIGDEDAIFPPHPFKEKPTCGPPSTVPGACTRGAAPGEGATRPLHAALAPLPLHAGVAPLPLHAAVVPPRAWHAGVAPRRARHAGVWRHPASAHAGDRRGATPPPRSSGATARSAHRRHMAPNHSVCNARRRVALRVARRRPNSPTPAPRDPSTRHFPERLARFPGPHTLSRTSRCPILPHR